MGVKGIRITSAATGQMYVTVGSHGFYYRKPIRVGKRAPRDRSIPFQPSMAPNTPGDQGEELISSTKSELVNDLNRRAEISSWPTRMVLLLAIALGISAFVVHSADRMSLDGHQASEYSDRALVALPSFIENYRGQDLSSRDLEGRVVVVDLTTRACYGCARALQLFREIAASFSPDQEISFLELDCTTKKQANKQKRKAYGSVPLASNGADIAKALAITSFPTLLIIDRTGREFTRISTKNRNLKTILNAAVAASFVTVNKPPGSAAIEGSFVPPSVAVGWMCLLSFAGLLAAVLSASRLKQRRHTDIVYHLDSSQQEKFASIQSGFQSLGTAHRIWEIISETSTYDQKRNAGCGTLVSRKAVRCGAMMIPNVSANVQVFGIEADSFRIFALPDALLYWRGGRFAAVDYGDIDSAYSYSRFTEDTSVPNDTRIVGETWRYVNKDGSPDRRFNNNRRLPVALYPEIKLRFNTNTQVHLQVSSVSAASEFMERFRGPNANAKSRIQSDSATRPNTSPQAGSERVWAAKVLGVDTNANTADIALAYRHLAQMYHPDKVASLAPEFQDLANQKMKDINRAFSILK